MNRNSYFNEKKENNIQKLNENDENLIQKEQLSEEEIKHNRYDESENSREDDLPVNEDLFRERNSIIKGISLAFVFFSVIIYSLLYMLAPEKSANLIFEGSYNSTLFNNTYCQSNTIKNIFYKLDTINIRDNMVIINISLNCILNENNERNNYLMIKMIYLNNTKIINNILINNNFITKEISNINEIFNDYKINDFPFWIYLYNNDKKENNNIKNITSDFLMKFF